MVRIYWVFHLKIKYPKLFSDPYYAFVYSRSRKIEIRKKKQYIVAEAAKMFILENDYGSTTTSKHGGLFICMMLCVE